MKKIILLSSLLTIGILSASDSGWYFGATKGVTNFGKGSFKVEQRWKSNERVENSPTIFKLGYLSNSSFRFEGYYKKDSISLSEKLFDVTTMGIRSEIGFLPFGKSSAFSPFFSSAFGVGNSSSNYLMYDDGVVMEYELGLGIHYNINKKFDISGGLVWRKIENMVDTDDFDANSYQISTSTNGIEIGATYHF